MSTVDEARELLLELLPPGADELYDLTDGSDPFLIFDALGEALKSYALDLVDILRVEVPGSILTQKLPDWEKALEIVSQLAATFGTTDQRRAAVVARLRESGAFCDPVVTSIFHPLLGYDAATPVEILKCDRSALRLLHSYGLAVDIVVPASGSIALSLYVPDGGKVTLAGAQLDLTFSAAGMQVQLASPAGQASTSWTPTQTPCRLASRAFAGVPVNGSWTLTLTNPTGAPITLYSGPWLFVEGIGRGLDTGGASAHWGIYADPSHLGEDGNAPDLTAVLRAIARIKHSHTVGSLITSKEPQPGASSAVPGRFIPKGN